MRVRFSPTAPTHYTWPPCSASTTITPGPGWQWPASSWRGSAWLYREPTLRDEIQRLRRRHTDEPQPAPPSSQRASAESVQRRLEAAVGEVTRLKQENRQLREQVARLHGARRVAPARRHPPTSQTLP